MSLELAYTVTTKGAMTFTGNASGLSQEAYANQPGTEGSIGAFTSLDSSLRVGFFPYGDYGTTLNIDENGSNANLVIPQNTTVLYAQLIWGGLHYLNYDGTEIDLSDMLTDPVTFTTPDGDANEIAPEMTYVSENSDIGLHKIYTNTADVTTIVNNAGRGTYSVEKIVGTTFADITKTRSLNHAGWTLAVVYADDSLPERSMTIWKGNTFIDPTSMSYADIEIDSFTTPKTGEFSTRLLLSAQEGDADLTGDTLLFGKDIDALVKISGLNNPEDNFFASQINGDDGLIDETGSFGVLNADAFSGTNTSGGRQGWDITNIDVSEYMTNLQTEAVLRMTTDGDAYAMNAVGLQVDVLLIDAVVTKSVDKSNVAVGDIVTFTVEIENYGDATIDEIVFSDTDIEGGTFVAKSLTIDGVADETADPNDGVSLGTLAVGEVRIVTFQVEIMEVPKDGSTVNIATVKSYVSGVLMETIDSNAVALTFQTTELSITNAVDKTETYDLEILTYTILVENIGESSATTISLDDLLDSTLTYVESTLTINGVVDEKQTPDSTISLADLAVGETATITFQAITDTEYAEGFSIKNTAVVHYASLDDPTTTVDATSNEVETIVMGRGVVVVKSADANLVKIGDAITYTVEISTRGNGTITNLVLQDVLGDSVDFIENTVTINGEIAENTSPETGIALPDITAKESVIVTFQVLAVAENKAFPNTATANYTKEIQNQSINQTTNSEEVNIMILGEPITTVTKLANPTTAEIGDVVTFTVTFENTNDFALAGLVFADAYDTGYDFVEGSVTINGVSDATLDVSKFAIKEIEGLATTTVTYDMTVNESAVDLLKNAVTISYTVTDPDTGESEDFTLDSNTAVVTVTTAPVPVDAKVSLKKSADDTFVAVGDVVTYTLEVTNEGNVALEDITVYDVLPAELSFVIGSVKVDNELRVDDNLLSGITIDALAVEGVSTITFEAEVMATGGGKVENVATVNADYTSGADVFTVTADSNAVTLAVILPELTIEKMASTASASLDEIVQYKITLTNTGEVDFNEVTLFDTLPEAMEFVADSLTLNGITINSADLANGFVIGQIAVDEVVKITYEAKVLSGTCDSKLENSAYAIYEYTFSDDEKGTGQTETVTASIVADISNFKQIALNSQVGIPPQKPDLQSLDDATAEIEITEFYVVRVIDGISNEGQRLFGHKLVVHGEVHASIEYTSCFDSVFSAHWDIPFTTYIVLPKDYRPNKKIDVRGIIENVSAEALNERDLDIGTLALIVASIQ